MVNAFYDSYCILNKVYSDGAYIKQAMATTLIEEKNRAQITKICYGVLDKDIFLSDRIKRLCDKNPKLVVRTVLKIAIYNIEFLKKAPYAVTDSAVELLNKLGKKGVSGFVNAVLRKYVKTTFPPIGNDAEGLSLKYDYPVFAVKKLISFYGKEKAESIMNSSSELTGIRFRKGFDGEKYLSDADVKFFKTPYEGFFVAEKFTRNEDFDKGIYTFQSIGSVAIVYALLEAFKGDKASAEILDACAAPGGKSVLLSEFFGHVYAEEIHPHRVELIRQYAKRMGAENILAGEGDACIYNERFGDKFGAVLCDVPCSGFGVLKSNPDIKLHRTEENIKELTELQLKILNNCCKYLVSGGVLAYSTCSVFDEENDGVVAKFLKENTDFSVVEIKPEISYLKTEFGAQFLPDECFGAGFYVAVLRKN